MSKVTKKVQRCILKTYPRGMPDEQRDFEFDTFEIDTGDLSALPTPDHVVVKVLYLSVDPYLRGMMKPGPSKGYFQPFPLGEPVVSLGLAQVVLAGPQNSAGHVSGDIVTGTFPWQTYATVEGKTVRKWSFFSDNKDNSGLPLSYALGVLGMPGVTSYFGLLDITHPKSGETVLVSGAAGAVGSVVGQIAKLKGCRVVGIAGGEDKCRYLTEELGFDEVINYKTVPRGGMTRAVEDACPDGVDVYFDNVGGETLDAAVINLNDYGRISLCGSISQYNMDTPDMGPRLWFQLTVKNAKAEGFLVNRWNDRWDEAVAQLAQWVQEGKIKYRETVEDGFERIVQAFAGLFTGHNIGKMLVHVADPCTSS